MIPLQQFAAVSFGADGLTAPTFLDAGTGAKETPISGTLQVPYPATVAAGNFLVLPAISSDSVGGSITTPSGWTQIRNNLSGDTTHVYAAFYKVADGTETGNLDVTVSTADLYAAGRIYRFSHGSGTEAAGVAATDTAGTSLVAVDVTTLGDKRLAVQLWSANVNSTIGDMMGESGADYAEATAEYAVAGLVMSCQIASVASAAAITGGSAAISSGAYRLRIGFAIKP